MNRCTRGRALALLLPLAACSLPAVADLPTSPGDVAQTTTVDEQAALAVTLAYTGAARAAALAIETGLIADRDTIARIGALNRSAYTAVQAVERAYRAGNADSYLAALADARAAVTLMLDAVKGDAR